MVTRQASFGRRISPQAQTAPPLRAAQKVTAPTPTEPSMTEPATGDSPSVDQELLEWKRARGSKFAMPWSQLSLMASLCFGIASFVLPDSVNEKVDWLLWALTAITAMVWYTNRKKKKSEDSAAP